MVHSKLFVRRRRSLHQNDITVLTTLTEINHNYKLPGIEPQISNPMDTATLTAHVHMHVH